MRSNRRRQYMIAAGGLLIASSVAGGAFASGHSSGAQPEATAQRVAVAQSVPGRELASNPRKPIRFLGRYVTAQGRHWATTGRAPRGYRLEGRVIILSRHLHGTIPLYGCLNRRQPQDQFLSLRRNCEGHKPLRLEGYVYKARPKGKAGRRTFPIYRCFIPGFTDHFFSVRANCKEGPRQPLTNAEGRFGYAGYAGR
jgi:hypothetical protein